MKKKISKNYDIMKLVETGLLEIVARARDTLTERQPMTVPEEAVRTLCFLF